MCFFYGVGEKPKTGPAAKNGPAVEFWLGQLWLSLFLAGPKFGCWPSFGWAIDLPSHNWPRQFFLNFGWAKNGCGWPSQTGFSPTLFF